MNTIAIVVTLIGLVGLVIWAYRVEHNTALAVQLVLTVGGLLYLAAR